MSDKILDRNGNEWESINDFEARKRTLIDLFNSNIHMEHEDLSLCPMGKCESISKYLMVANDGMIYIASIDNNKLLLNGKDAILTEKFLNSFDFDWDNFDFISLSEI